MAATPSTMIPLGAEAPTFQLPDTVSGKDLSLEQLKGENATVILFICNHCPYVVHINEELVKVANEYIPQQASFIAISSNNVEKYPQDGPEQMKAHAKEVGYPFPYLYDETQEIAKSYQAACTPDLFVFDADLKCVYRGQFDDTRPKSGRSATGQDLRNALDSVLAGEPVSEEQFPSIGCNIKWKQ